MTAKIHRRTLLASGAAVLALAACGGEKPPTVLSVTASGAKGMNPGPDGADRPVTLTVLQMSGSGKFNAADYYALQDPAAALGADLLRADQIVLSPGAPASKAITVEAGATAIGVLAGFRTPTGRNTRQLVTVPPKSTTMTISVGAKGLSVTTG